ncbi:MAG: serine protease [Geminicoccaceae bacterium]|jgi:hypothetical protein|nr:serine protease [Geminicoccaceae bacterium]
MARQPRKASRRDDNPPSGIASEPELIVVTRPEAAMRASAGRFEAMSGESTDTLASVLSANGASMRPLFGPTEERVLASAALVDAMAAEPVELATFYKVDAPPAALDALQAQLLASDLVAAAYVKPPAEPAAFLNDMAPAADEAPPATPDFSSRQGYLDAAPGGVEARWAWTQAGGRGDGIRIIDIEGAWRFTHEDLASNQGGVVGGTQSADIVWRNHGTAVLGEYSGDQNSFGIVGIASNATASAVAIFGGLGSAGAINAAASRLSAGDVILLELHRPGPRFNFANRGDQRGYIAIEWWPDDFAAIRTAVARGIIVIEAAGNGAENLDDGIYQNPAPGFPAGWTNPFRRANRDSGAIMVGAGAPPPGTHGRTHGADRSRLDFSNFGALIDTQGWGREVTTSGYGDLQGGGNEDLWYTDTFSGTSSASPIIVGVAASLQGMARARGRPLLTPAQFRNCLRTTGSPQQDEPGRPATQRVGNRPNLRQLSVCAFGKSKEIAKEVVKEVAKEVVKEAKEGKELAKELKDARKEIKDAKEGKEFAKELKDARKEIKDAKEGKEIAKELKDARKELKDGKEVKERPDKNIKEKDKEKDAFEGGGGGIREGIGGGIGPQTGGADVEGRLAAVEQTLQTLVHFITQEMRPDLGGSAIGGDAGQMAQEDQQAKAWKDQKDTESY